MSLRDHRRLDVDPSPRLDDAGSLCVDGRLAFLITHEAMERLGGGELLRAGAGAFHLDGELSTIALALRDPPVGGEARSTYQLAKSIEFLCETLRRFRAGELTPPAGESGLSPADTRRIVAARRMIEERAGEKLPLDRIARACGLNRSKLTRGFRELYGCSVAEALCARRLELARAMLVSTDKPVGCIGHQAGYLNNASFTRAFGRRFGRSPSDYRSQALAA